MESAGRQLDDRELGEAMRDRGLGTPATRAGIIETLIQRGYVIRNGKAFEAQEKGIDLIKRVHPHVKSPEMTGDWEFRLKKVEQGKAQLDVFMREIETFVASAVAEVLAGATTAV